MTRQLEGPGTATVISGVKRLAWMAVASAWVLPLQADEAVAPAGFSPAGAARQMALKRRIAASLSPARIERHLKRLTRAPHLPGSDGTAEVVSYLEPQLESLAGD